MEKFENLNEIIKNNLIYYRKKAKLTQSELAAKLNYSDKSISKWERGDGVPDIHVFAQLADLYGLTVNDFLTTKKKEKIANMYISKVLITTLSVLLVWFVTIIAFFILNVVFRNNDTIQTIWPFWLLFIYAIPVSCIVLIVFFSIYFKRILNIIPISLLCWTLALSLYLSLRSVQFMNYIFLIAIPFQVIIILFFVLLDKKKR